MPAMTSMPRRPQAEPQGLDPALAASPLPTLPEAWPRSLGPAAAQAPAHAGFDARARQRWITRSPSGLSAAMVWSPRRGAAASQPGSALLRDDGRRLVLVLAQDSGAAGAARQLVDGIAARIAHRRATYLIDLVGILAELQSRRSELLLPASSAGISLMMLTYDRERGRGRGLSIGQLSAHLVPIDGLGPAQRLSRRDPQRLLATEPDGRLVVAQPTPFAFQGRPAHLILASSASQPGMPPRPGRVEAVSLERLALAAARAARPLDCLRRYAAFCASHGVDEPLTLAAARTT